MRSIHARTGATAALVLLFQPAIANEWSYFGGTGPEHWGGNSRVRAGQDAVADRP